MNDIPRAELEYSRPGPLTTMDRDSVLSEGSYAGHVKSAWPHLFSQVTGNASIPNTG